MMRTRWRLLKVFGIPIYADASWLIILALLTLSLAHAFPPLLQEYFPNVSDNFEWYRYWIMGLITALADWPAIVTPAESDRLRALLTAPKRHTEAKARKYLLRVGCSAAAIAAGFPDPPSWDVILRLLRALRRRMARAP